MKRNDRNFGIDRVECSARGFSLRRADRLGAIEDLALQVGEVDLVGVGDRQAPKAGGGEVQRRGAAEAARADDQDARASQPLLPLDTDLGEQDMAAVAEELLVVQFGLGALPLGCCCATVGDWLFTGSPLRKAIACES